MLDLGAVKGQIDQMALHQKQSQDDYDSRIERSVHEIRRWSGEWRDLSHDVDKSKTSWLVARLSGPPDAQFHPAARPKRLTVVATDGSQIFPDRHEVSPCFLLNVGYVVIHYGTGERPILSSRPSLYYKEEDLYEEVDGRRSRITRESVGIRRGVLEFSYLANLSIKEKEEGRSVVALSDGTLIQWSLEGRPPNLRLAMLQKYLDAFEKMRLAGVPFAGYISSPGSADVINSLRVGLCPEEPTNCDACPWKAELRERLLDGIHNIEPPALPGGLPCSPIEGVTDQILFSRVLEKGERSGIFHSQSKILNDYGPHRISFFYLNTGSEIARVEIPAWVAENPNDLGLLHASLYDQAQKGKGYPVALSEAHEKAVVRGPDRELFYRFLRDTLIRNEVRAEISLKGLKKITARI